MRSCACLKYGFFVLCDSFGARRIWIPSPLCVTYCICLQYSTVVFISDPPSFNSPASFQHAHLLLSLYDKLLTGTLLPNDWWCFLFFPTPSSLSFLSCCLTNVCLLQDPDVRGDYIVTLLFLPSLNMFICNNT